MKQRKTAFFLSMLIFLPAAARPAGGLIPRFVLEPSDIELTRLAQPNTYFDKCGRKFAILGFESGSFEAWAYPLKLIRNFEFSFLLGSTTEPVPGKEIVRRISVTPEATILTFTFQSFTVRAIYVTAVEDAGAVILLAVDTVEPMTIVCSFVPVLQPMWPAGLGGQRSSWNDELKAFVIDEPTRKNHGLVGSPVGRGISYTPAHMLSDAPNQFEIRVESGEAVKEKYIPVILAGGKGKGEEVRKAYEKLAADPEAVYRSAAEHYRRLRQETLRVITTDKMFNRAFEWSKVAYDNLRVENPDLGQGLVAGLGTSGAGGRPGFGWFFGGDAYLNSLSLDGCGAFAAVKEALLFTQKWQRRDGKMAHELSQAAGYIDWFRDYPYGYIHGDTTPFYLGACWDYVQNSGDLAFAKESWPSIQKAFDWCLTTDSDGDGLMDNEKAGLGALEFGSLTRIRTDIYLSAAWLRAAHAVEKLALAVGDSAYERSARNSSAKAETAFEAKFWDEENGRYAYAFNADGAQVKELTPWAAVAIAWGLGNARRGCLTLEKINSSELTTDWGVRLLSKKSRYFEPLNYNYGAVWPFLNGWTAAALYMNGYSLQGFGLLSASARHTFDNDLGAVTELFSGNQNVWPQEAVPHQGFSTGGFVYPFIRGLLGLEGDALKREIHFAPRLRPDWTEVRIENFSLGSGTHSIRYEREARRIRLGVRSATGGAKLYFSPSLGPGTRILSATINGKSVPVKEGVTPGGQSIQARIELGLTAEDSVVIEIEPTVEFLPPDNTSETGDPNRGLRIIRTESQDRGIKVIGEGLSGETYELKITNPDLIRSVTGAELDGARLRVHFPPASPAGYVPFEISLSLK